MRDIWILQKGEPSQKKNKGFVKFTDVGCPFERFIPENLKNFGSMADLTCVGRINLYFQKSFEWIQLIRKRKDINKFSTIYFVLAISKFQYVRRVSYIECLHSNHSISDSIQILYKNKSRKKNNILIFSNLKNF